VARNQSRSHLNAVKQGLLRLLALPGFTEALAALTNTRATIFMLHRFSVPELGVTGHAPAALRRTLAHLRKERYNLLPLYELFQRLRNQEPLKRAIAFTIDDGYFDHAQVAGPVFADFDCPVTTFLATGFIDGETWFWWDKLTYIFEKTRRDTLRACVGNQELVYRLDSNQARLECCWDLNVRCQDAPEADRLACVSKLSSEADVELPARPPAQFAPLSWEEARAAERRGMTFGPHTVTHPVLSTAGDTQAEAEIKQSWMRLTDELRRPVPIFAYPNGRWKDFGEREIGILRRLGFSGALAGQPGHLHPSQFRDVTTVPYRVPRFGYSDSLHDVLQCVSGLESVKSRLRRAAA
jgi:peptidoglycan/xylan/chitin deacetylase (PgdA/CDA1 family)